MKKLTKTIILFVCIGILLSTISCKPKEEDTVPIDPRVIEVTENFFNIYWDPELKYFYLYNTTRITWENHEARPGAGRYTDFWVEAQLFETVMDVYERQRKEKYLTLIHNVFDGFITSFPKAKFRKNKYNDDIGWWAMACTRAYSLTEDLKFLDAAKEMFDYLYERGFSEELGGGIFWNTDRGFKNTCTNAPAIVTAVRLSKYFPNSDYLNIATNLFLWLKENVFEDATGKVYDGVSIANSLSTGQHIYNYGTFALAAYELHKTTENPAYLEYAKKAIDYALSSEKIKDSILVTDTTNDGSAFRGIFLRTLNIFAKNGFENYQQIINLNAISVYDNRRATDNLTGYDWTSIAEDDLEIYSSNAATAVSLMQYFLP